MTNSERIEKLQEALDLIMGAQYLVEEAVNGTRQEAHFKAYGQYNY